MTDLNRKILLVDDEQSLLDGLRRQYRKDFDIETACGGEAGLEAVIHGGPFAVVVTDYNMPGLNGSQLLELIAEFDEDIVRIMLTGQADQQTAVEAINRGRIFRFLNKPCEPDDFRACIDAALVQYGLRRAERELLELTMRGSIEVLADVLSLSNPRLFGRARRIRDLVCQVLLILGLRDPWQLETAALLSQIGMVSIPTELVDRALSGVELTAAEESMIARHSLVARDLLHKIPRLESVAEIVARQAPDCGQAADEVIDLGGRILGAAADLEQALSRGESKATALAKISESPRDYGRDVIDALAMATLREDDAPVEAVAISQLRVGMVLCSDIHSEAGGVIASGGYEVTQGTLRRLRNYLDLHRIQDRDILVEAPGEPALS